MKIALFGASGTIGQRILNEALRRGHTVTAVSRNPAKITVTNPDLTVVVGDILDPKSVAEIVAGQNVVISAYGPDNEAPADTVLQATRALIDGLRQAGVKHLIVVGGAGSLEVAPGQQLVDQPEFPEGWRPVALAHRDVLNLFTTDAGDLDWTYFSPAALIEPGHRTGAFRIGGDELLTDDQGNSRISAEDYAVALLDEVEQPQHIRRRFTAAY